MHPRLSLFSLFLLSCARSSPDIQPEPSRTAPWEPPPLIPVGAAPELVAEKPAKAPGVMPGVTAQAPKKNQLIPTEKSADFEIKFALRSWKISENGNGVHVLLDNKRVRRLHNPKKKLKLGDFTGNQPLDEGEHILAILPVHPNGESVKPTKFRSPIAIIPFYVGKKTEPTWKEKEPMVIMNAPASGKIPKEGALIDFYLVNAELMRGKTTLHIAVSGPDFSKAESLVQWTPWRVKNAQPGEYLAKFEIFRYVPDSFESGSAVQVNLVSKPVPGKWASVTREYILENLSIHKRKREHRPNCTQLC